MQLSWVALIQGPPGGCRHLEAQGLEDLLPWWVTPAWQDGVATVSFITQFQMSHSIFLQYPLSCKGQVKRRGLR